MTKDAKAIAELEGALSGIVESLAGIKADIDDLKAMERDAKDTAKPLLVAYADLRGEDSPGFVCPAGKLVLVRQSRSRLDKGKLAAALAERGVSPDVVQAAMDEATAVTQSEYVMYKPVNGKKG